MPVRHAKPFYSIMFNPMDYSGRRFLVTGASSGIGRETATLLSRLGARVLLVGRDPVRLEQACQALEGSGHSYVTRDLSDVDPIPNWLISLSNEMGPFDGLVHSAGAHSIWPLAGVNQARIASVFQINVNAAFSLVKAYRLKGVCTGYKSVVLISSVVGLVGQAGVSIYSASKGAVIALTRSLALELADEGIRVNCIAAGLVQTELTERVSKTLGSQRMSEIIAMHPLGLGHASDVALAAAFLLGDSARWITGTAMVVDGGYTTV